MRPRIVRFCYGFGLLLGLLFAVITVMSGCGGGEGEGGGAAGIRVWIETDPAPVSAGESARAWLMISEPTGVAGVDLAVAFDADLLSLSKEEPISKTALTNDFAVACSDQTPGSLTVFMANATGATGGGSEELLQMTFAVDSSVPAGTRIPLLVTLLRVYNDEPSEIELAEVSGGEILVQ